MRLQSACYLVGAALCLTAPAWGQSTAITPTSTRTGTHTTSTGTGTTSTGTGTGTQTTSASTGTQTSASTSTGAFQNLSPGGQKITQSLFDAQHPPTGTKALTLDQIAALKGKEGWGRVFKEMKADGLVQAKNLGQVVSGHAKTAQTKGSTTSSTQTTSSARTGSSRHVSTRTTGGRAPVVVTSGSGRSTVYASIAGRGGHGRFASNASSHFTTAGGPSGYGGGFSGGGHGGGGGSSHGGGRGK